MFSLLLVVNYEDSFCIGSSFLADIANASDANSVADAK